MAFVTIAVEGNHDEAVALRICNSASVDSGTVYVAGGKSRLDSRLSGYNNAARFSPWFVLRDLNGDASCPAELRDTLLPARSPQMLLRIPVRAVEAWLMADRAALSTFLRVPVGSVPPDPESIARPKRSLVDIARQSRNPAIVEDFVPRPGTGREVGPGYTARVIDFVTRTWDPDRAAASAESLRKCLHTLRSL